MKKKKTEDIPVNPRHARLTAYATPTPEIPVQPIRAKPAQDNESKLRAQIEAQAPWLRLEYVLHEPRCTPPCRCRVRARVTRFAKYGRSTRHLVIYREPL